MTLLSMPRLRKRHILSQLEKFARFWPVTGLLGLRQSGKSTDLRELMKVKNYYENSPAMKLE